MKYWILVLSLVSGGFLQAQSNAMTKEEQLKFYMSQLEQTKMKMGVLSERRSACELMKSDPNYFSKMRYKILEVIGEYTLGGAALGTAVTTLTEHNREVILRRAKAGGFWGGLLGIVAGIIANEIDRPEPFRREVVLLSDMTPEQIDQEHEQIMKEIIPLFEKMKDLEQTIRDLKAS